MFTISPIDTGRPERTVARRAGTSTGRRAGLFLGRCSRPTICLPTVEALPASDTRSHITRSSHGAREVTVLLKMATPRRYKDPDHMKRIAGDIYGGSLRNSPELAGKHVRHVRWSSDYGYYLQLLAGFGWSSLPWLRRLVQPTLVMAGTDDPLVPVINGRILARLIPNARLVAVNDGHLFLVTNAEDSAKIISEFLSDAAT